MPEAYFTVDGDSYVPSAMTRGPWGALMGGQIVGGLLAWGIECSGVDPDFQPARLTIDLLRPVPIEPVQIRVAVQREGRRIKLVDATLEQHGNEGTEGAERGLAAITTGLGWERVSENVVVAGKPGKADLEACWNLGATVAATLMA